MPLGLPTTAASSASARSVAWMPGSRLLIVTPFGATCRLVPATKPVSPARAAFDRPSAGIGALTDWDVMLTTRPHPRSIIAGQRRLHQRDRRQHVGVERADEIVAGPVRPQSGRRPAGVRDEDVRIWAGGEHRRATFGSGDVGYHGRDPHPVTIRIAFAAAASAPSPRALITRSTPASASASAQPRPSPLDAAQTTALRPRIPRSTDDLPIRRPTNPMPPPRERKCRSGNDRATIAVDHVSQSRADTNGAHCAAMGA